MTETDLERARMEKPAIQDRRRIIDRVQEIIAAHPGSVKGDTDMAPLNHLFTDGVYIRQIFLPAGTLATSSIHKKSYCSFILTGRVAIFSDYDGESYVEAPKVVIAPAGVKRVVYAISDTVWCTVHANPDEIRDPDELRKMCVVDTYEEYNEEIRI